MNQSGDLVAPNGLILHGERPPDMEAIQAELERLPAVVGALTQVIEAEAAVKTLGATTNRLNFRARECLVELSGADVDLRNLLISGDRAEIEAKLQKTVLCERELGAIRAAVRFVIEVELPAAQVAQLRRKADHLSTQADAADGAAEARAKRIADALASATQDEGAIEIRFTGAARWLKMHSYELRGQAEKAMVVALELEQKAAANRVAMAANGAITRDILKGNQ